MFKVTWATEQVQVQPGIKEKPNLKKRERDTFFLLFYAAYISKI
jgi:hypothetical protein